MCLAQSSDGSRDAFVAQFSATDGSLVATRSLGGGGEEEANALATDAGAIYLAGTFSDDFSYENSNGGPVSGGTIQGEQDLFVAKLDGSLEVTWITTAGGNEASAAAHGLAPDNGGTRLACDCFKLAQFETWIDLFCTFIGFYRLKSSRSKTIRP